MERVIKKAISLGNPQAADDGKALRDGAGLLWRTGSGHAHATLSSRMRMTKLDNRRDGSGRGRSRDHARGAVALRVVPVAQRYRGNGTRLSSFATSQLAGVLSVSHPPICNGTKSTTGILPPGPINAHNTRGAASCRSILSV